MPKFRMSPRRAACATLCLAACALWVRSHFASDRLVYRCDGGWRSVRLARGHVVFGMLLADWSDRGGRFDWPEYATDVPTSPLNDLMFLNPDSGDRDVSWERAGFARYEKWKTRGVGHLRWVAPFWAVVLVAATAAVIPPWRDVFGRRGKRLRLCPTCGYELRGTPERCPCRT